jgi:hypothetical protein
MTLLNVFEAYAAVSPRHRESWCSRHGLLLDPLHLVLP